MKHLKILIVGDLHGKWRFLNALISKQKPDIVIVCGDFGWWPRWHNFVDLRSDQEKARGRLPRYWDSYGLKNGDTKVYFCDGNHDDIESLNALENNEVMPNVFYMKRGSTLTLLDGRKVLFMGGAESIGTDGQTLGWDWYPTLECISHSDFENLPDENIDIVISHTCPACLVDEMLEADVTAQKGKDPSVQALHAILGIYQPKLWYFGHWHWYKTGVVEKTEWTALNHSSSGSTWWVELKEKNEND